MKKEKFCNVDNIVDVLLSASEKWRHIIAALFCIFAITANAQFLFRIDGGGLEKPSYILGSIHTLPGSLLDSIPEFLKAEAECQQLYAEYDIDDQQKMDELKTVGQQVTNLPDGKTIFDVLSKEQIDVLNAKYNEVFHINLTDSAMKAVWNYMPFVHLSTFNLIFTFEEIRKHPEMSMTTTPMDHACILRAKERGLTVGLLDQIQSQDSLAKMRDKWMESLDTQVDSLMQFLNNFEQRKQQAIEEIQTAIQYAEYWKLGDFDSFANSDFWISEVDKNSSLFKRRNEKWLPKITNAMREAPTLFVFGAGHLIGQYGVLQLLRDAGYEVEQIKKNK